MSLREDLYMNKSVILTRNTANLRIFGQEGGDLC